MSRSRTTTMPAKARSTVLLALAAALGTAAPAMAAPQPPPAECFNGGGPTRGIWSTTSAFNYGPGGWCMHYGSDRSYRLVWQQDGNLVAYHNASANVPRDARWASNTSGRGARLSFQTDGNLVIYDSANHAVWASGTHFRNSPTGFFLEFNPAMGGPTPVVLRLSQNSPAVGLWSVNV
jgi:hypothetical protein